MQSPAGPQNSICWRTARVSNRWDEKAGLRRDAVGSQVIDALEAQEKAREAPEPDYFVGASSCGDRRITFARSKNPLKELAPGWQVEVGIVANVFLVPSALRTQKGEGKYRAGAGRNSGFGALLSWRQLSWHERLHLCFCASTVFVHQGADLTLQFSKPVLPQSLSLLPLRPSPARSGGELHRDRERGFTHVAPRSPSGR